MGIFAILYLGTFLSMVDITNINNFLIDLYVFFFLFSSLNTHTHTYIYIYIYIIIIIMPCHQHGYPLLPLLPIVHHFWQVIRATSRILTELLNVVSSWLPCFCLAIWGVHRRTLLMRSSLLLQQCPACLVRLTLIVFLMGYRWLHSCCFVRCCLLDLPIRWEQFSQINRWVKN